MQQAVAQSIKDGTPFSTFKKNIKPTLQKKGWYGLKDIVNPKTGEIKSVYIGSKERQKRAAVITAYSLGINIVLSLVLIVPFGAVGLVVASSFGGFVLLYLSLREFGFTKFCKLIKIL
jgi:hypothetical protein